jgi:ribonuclease Z
MRKLWVAVLSAVLACAGAGAQTAVVLVGTGGPELTPERQGEATLVEARGQMLLFDAGRGVLDGLYRSRVQPQDVTRVFLTHLHSDHIEGLPGLWITPWFLLGRKTALEVWGPVGTRAMVDGMRAMFAHDLQHRPNATAKREYLDITVHEVGPGVAYNEGGVRVMAVPVEHADGDPAFGYVVETGDARILLTGDCTSSGALTEMRGPFDLVVSNVAAGSAAMEKEAWIQPVLAKLMRPAQAAELFQETRPRMAVFSHIVKKGLPGAAGAAEVLQRTRAAGYKGPLVMGQDHMRIVLGKTVRVERESGKLPDFDGPGSKFWGGMRKGDKPPDAGVDFATRSNSNEFNPLDRRASLRMRDMRHSFAFCVCLLSALTGCSINTLSAALEAKGW